MGRCLLVCLLCAAPLLAGPAEDVVDAQLRVVTGLEAQVPAIAGIADETAKRLVDGGALYLAGERGMVGELVVRAGGLCGAQALRPGTTPLTAKDTVLLSDYGSSLSRPGSGWGETAGTGALRILFVAKAHWVFAKRVVNNVRLIPVEIPADSRLVRLPSGEKLVPACAPAIAIAQWTFVAELIGACRRQGKQLAVYLSIHLDEGRKRYERTKGLMFEPDLKPEAAPQGGFAKAFLAHVRASLEAVRRDEAPKLRQAAAWLREAKAAGRGALRHLYGHLPPHEAGAPGDPPLFTRTVSGPVGERGVEWTRKNLRQGDAYLLVGYQQNQDAMAAAASAVGARTIFITSLGPGPEQAQSPRHLYINPHWPLTDGCLELPGYDVKACPLSGILGLTCYHAICAEALATE